MGVKIGETLKKLRSEKDLTQEQLAAILNVSDKAISKWESDAGLPELDNLMRLSQFFEISIDALFKGEIQRYTYGGSSGSVRDNPGTVKNGGYKPEGTEKNTPDAHDKPKAGPQRKALLFKYILFTYLFGGTFMFGQIAFGARQVVDLPLNVFTVQTCLIMLLAVFHVIFAVMEVVSAYSGKTVFKALSLAFSSGSLIITVILMCVPPLGGGSSAFLLPWLFLTCLLLLNIYIVFYYAADIANVYFPEKQRLFNVLKLVFLGAFAGFLLYPLIYSLTLLFQDSGAWWSLFSPYYTGQAAWLIVLSLFLIYAALNEASPLLKNHVSVSIVKTLFLVLAAASPIFIFSALSREFFLARESFVLSYDNTSYIMWWSAGCIIALLAECAAGIAEIYQKTAAAKTVLTVGLCGVIIISVVNFILFLENAECTAAFSLTCSFGPITYRVCAFVMALAMILVNLPFNTRKTRKVSE